jgi:hypothetical protein
LTLDEQNWIGDLAAHLDSSKYVLEPMNKTGVKVIYLSAITGSRSLAFYVFQIQTESIQFMLAPTEAELKDFVPSQAVPGPTTKLNLPAYEILKADAVTRICPETKVGDTIVHSGAHHVLSTGWVYNSNAFAGYVVELKTHQLEEQPAPADAAVAPAVDPVVPAEVAASASAEQQVQGPANEEYSEERKSA